MDRFFRMDDASVSLAPDGANEEFLKRQLSGLTGHAENAGQPFASFAWNRINYAHAAAQPPLWRWVEYEQVAYRLDGLVNAAAFLKDDGFLSACRDEIMYAIENADDSGYIGPLFLKEPGKTNRWPHVIFFRAALSLYRVTGERKIVDAIERHYLLENVDYSKGRNFVNVEIMLSVYFITGNRALLEKAEATYRAYHSDEDKDALYCGEYTLERSFLDRRSPYEHGVTYNEIAKLGALLYAATGEEKYLAPAVNAYRKLERFHLLPDGLHSANEYLRGKGAEQTHEMCDASDYTWSLRCLLMATGDGKYADKIEKCIYNAAIGAVTEDFRAIQYFSGLNQVVLDGSSNRNFYRRGSSWTAYRPGHETQCCTGNVSRFFPNFLRGAYMSGGDDFYAVFYVGGEVTAKLDCGVFSVKATTDYPFGDGISFVVTAAPDAPVSFHTRIPGWCDRPTASLNGKSLKVSAEKGFMKIERTFSPGDRMTFDFPSEAKVRGYGKNGVVVERGPILYALGGFGERKKVVIDGCSTEDFPCYEMRAVKPWNYGIDIAEADARFVAKKRNGYPWSIDGCPLTVEVTARRLPEWKTEKRSSVVTTDSESRDVYRRIKGNFEFTPPIPKGRTPCGEKERITLYPFAVCKLRISVFPEI